MSLGLFARRTTSPVSTFLTAWSASTFLRGRSWGFRENWQGPGEVTPYHTWRRVLPATGPLYL